MDSNETPERLLTAAEVAAWLGLSIGTIRNKASRKEIPHEKVGGSVRFRRSAIEAWIESHPAEAVAKSA